MSPKRPSEAELAELLKLAESPREPGEKNEVLDSVKHWIIEIGLGPGPDKVRSHTLWFCYKKWASEPVTAYLFYRLLRRYLGEHYRQSDKFHYYRLDESVLNLTDAEREDIRATRRAQRIHNLEVYESRRASGRTRKNRKR